MSLARFLLRHIAVDNDRRGRFMHLPMMWQGDLWVRRVVDLRRAGVSLLFGLCFLLTKLRGGFLAKFIFRTVSKDVLFSLVPWVFGRGQIQLVSTCRSARSPSLLCVTIILFGTGGAFVLLSLPFAKRSAGNSPYLVAHTVSSTPIRRGGESAN